MIFPAVSMFILETNIDNKRFARQKRTVVFFIFFFFLKENILLLYYNNAWLYETIYTKSITHYRLCNFFKRYQ